MKQSDFDRVMKGTNAIYEPFLGVGDHYELIAISAEWRVGNPWIRVAVLDKNGNPANGVAVDHYYPGGNEHRQSVYPFYQFNLGPGSKTPVGEPGPDTIEVGNSGDESDIVRGLGIPNEGHDGYVGFTLTYKMTGGTPPPDGGVSEARVQAMIDASLADLVVRRRAT